MLKKYFKIILNIIFNFEMDHSDLKHIRRVKEESLSLVSPCALYYDMVNTILQHVNMYPLI